MFSMTLKDRYRTANKSLGGMSGKYRIFLSRVWGKILTSWLGGVDRFQADEVIMVPVVNLQRASKKRISFPNYLKP
jgi:hypothetical protein